MTVSTLIIIEFVRHSSCDNTCFD